MNKPEQMIRRQPEPLHVCVCRVLKVVPDALYIDGRFIESSWTIDVQEIWKRIGNVVIVLEFRWVANASDAWPESLSELQTLNA